MAKELRCADLMPAAASWRKAKMTAFELKP